MATSSDRSRPRDETGPGGNDMPPSGEEARAQRKATSMPLVWLLLGLVVALGFTLMATTLHRTGVSPAAPPAAAGAPSLPPVKQPAA